MSEQYGNLHKKIFTKYYITEDSLDYFSVTLILTVIFSKKDIA